MNTKEKEEIGKVFTENNCQICGEQALLETENREQISGDVCSICDNWVCQKCINYEYMKELNTSDTICKNCAKKGKTF